MKLPVNYNQLTHSQRREVRELYCRFQDWKCIHCNNHLMSANGLLHIEDHNSFTGKICCRKCWRSGIIDNNGQLLEEHRIYSNHNKK